MRRLVNKTPAYRLHRSDGRAVVTLDGQDIYLGKHATTESRAEYDRVIAVWLANGRRYPSVPGREMTDLTVNQLLLRFWEHAEEEYRHPDGSPASELEKLQLALRPVKDLFGSTPAHAFGPVALKAVRQAMVNAGLCRRTVNQRISRVVRVFRYGVENELIPASVHHGLKAVSGLKAGRGGAKESRKVTPVADEHVDSVRPYISRQLWTVIQLQRLTGMRSGEVLAMRGCDVDTSGAVWFYLPGRHKTSLHGKRREVPLGPRAREILGPWLRPDPSEYLFQPREAMVEFQAERRANRKTPQTPSSAKRQRKPRPARVAGTRYDTRTFNHAVARACQKAGVPRWHPHQLRHTAATRLRGEFGLEVARVVLGHGSPAVTEIYAEADRSKAVAAMERVG